ncbi:hypothetical protein [Clostridium tagluense]|uniref:Uncharacterized protein n=1 Tax=Clostridium tagluense TaxID=360422 RepID=A0A401USI7_9CLOT|nr:hypothetical protein [Clostridium tagluense]GCD12522.1 hypothetical protein Ctaglu_41450 [Clostridium tagluense]
MKKQNLLILALIISLLFGTYSFFSLKRREKTANELFKYTLSQSQFCFAQDYTIMKDDEKNYYYRLAASNLYTALSIVDLTSYGNNGKNNELTSAINELYCCMTEINTNDSRWKAVTEKRVAIYKYLTYISDNPNDKNSCDALSRLSNNLCLGVEDVVINYEGTSDNWHVGYKIDGNENSHDTYYTFKYTGKEVNLVKDVKYSIDTRSEGEEGEFSMDSTMVHTGKLILPTGFPKSTDRDMIVKIEWNGKEESLILKKSK